MRFSKQIIQSAMGIGISLLFGAILADPSSAASEPRVFFTSPTDKANVVSPVKVTMGAENFIVEPAGVVKVGAGHLHIMVDTDCIAVGKLIPKNDTHLHFGKGQMEAELKLTPGVHTLCLQGADGAHIALAGKGLTGLTEKITITVK